MNYSNLENSIITFIEKHLPNRLNHILGVREMSLSLASFYNESLEKASLASICHDLGRYLSGSEMRSLIKEKLNIDFPSYYTKGLMHSFASFIIARDEFYINDEDVLNAIKSHTTGHANMSMLEKIIYVSDYIEPSRNIKKTEKLRELVFTSFHEVLCETVKDSIVFVIQKNEYLAKETIELYNSLVLR